MPKLTNAQALLRKQAQAIKEKYMESMSNLDFQKERMEADLSDTVTLFHGTTSLNLNSILEKGILTRDEVGTSNWEHLMESIPNATYLTDKWHYFYAINATITYLQKEFGENWMKHQTDSPVFPCYVECRVPKNALLLDEDFILSQHMLKKIKKSIKDNTSLDLNPLECLKHYGTVGVMGAIPPEWIVSFTVLAEPEMANYVIDEKGQYFKDWKKWQYGRGKGELEATDLFKREQQSDLNGTWWMENFQKGTRIKKIGVNPDTQKISLVLEHCEDVTEGS